MDDKRDGKKDKKRSRSREKRRSPSHSPSYGRRRRERSRSRERIRRRSPPDIRRRRGRRSPSPPPPPSIQAAPPPPYISGAPMYDAYVGYGQPAPGYMGEMAPAYPAYDYGAPPPVVAGTDAYGGLMSGPPPMMLGQPGPPGEEYAAAGGWNTARAPAPPPIVQETEEEKRKREAAIALEVRNQRASLKQQRDDYKQRASALKRELKILKQQRSDLTSGREPPSPTTNSFIKENDKLQSQIESKINTIDNVIDMLEGIMGKDKSPTPPPPKLSESERMPTSKSPSKDRKGSESSSASPERLKNEVLETMKRGKVKKEEKLSVKPEPSQDVKPKAARYNNVYYDPELHWCSTCDLFPKTAKDYLNHLHSSQHSAKVTGPAQEFPWRAKLVIEDTGNDADLPAKRIPIRGLQFFTPATAWYCKLCHFWMGDLHCASVHLKSTQHSESYANYISSHSNFEIDWMSDRQKAYERMRDSDRQLASTTTRDVPDSGPLGGTAAGEVDFLSGAGSDGNHGSSKKKKNKKDDKEKKKKKRSKKKKKKRVSSSSSSSSSDSGSESDKRSSKGDDFDPATSIRVAMRNILKAQEAAKDAQQAENVAAGKWTVVQSATGPSDLTAPPPPFMTDGAESREKKRDELMISQWVTPDPIISESEKKMLEQLKGKLKRRDDGPPPMRRSREPDISDRRRGSEDRRRSKSVSPPWRRNRSPGRRGGFGRGGRRSPDRRRDRSRDRDMDRGGRFDRRRRSRSRSRGRRSPSYGRGRFRARRSFSRSRSRSRSRGRRVIEKPVVNFPPEPKPKPEKKLREKKDDDKKDKKPVTIAIGKKLPFIGRMPVFKKQQQDAKKEELVTTEQTTAGHFTSQENGAKLQPEEFVDMMPDPYQFVALMGAPPPPPSHPGKTDQNILPPGIDEADSDLVPKPISDAPIPRKGPLPKDFQEALDIIFDGDKQKPADVIANETKPPEIVPAAPVDMVVDNDQPQMIEHEAIEIYNQQIAAQYSTAVVSGPAVSYDDESQNQPLEMGQVLDPSVKLPAEPPALPTTGKASPVEDSRTSGNDDPSNGESEPPPQPPTPPEIENEETRRKRAELEELAMLGIDADDMAAQIF